METKALRFQCLNNGREVDAGISTVAAPLISIRIQCPVCETSASVVDDGSLGSVAGDTSFGSELIQFRSRILPAVLWRKYVKKLERTAVQMNQKEKRVVPN
jgi:hypothetical protein